MTASDFYLGLIFKLFLVLCRGYVGIHSSGFRDFLLKPELLRAIVDSGFEHPSEGKLLNSILIVFFFFAGICSRKQTMLS